MRKYVICLVFAFLTAACATPSNYPPPKERLPGPPIPPREEYTIQPGDQLDIRFFYNSELNDQMVVRPDGRISMQLIGEIPASGKTPLELTNLLKDKYEDKLKRPEITVIVRSFGSNRVYVDGEVRTPGVQNLIGPQTVLQMIANAGGFTDGARKNQVIIIRKGPENRPVAFTVNLTQTLEGKDLAQDVPIVASDIIYVPKSPVAQVNYFVDYYIRKNIPIPLGVGFGYDFAD